MLGQRALDLRALTRMTTRTPAQSIHEACFAGDLRSVRELLAAGVDPDMRAEPGGRTWISSAGADPRPLNCVAIARAVTEAHVEIARLLISHGAVVDDTVFQDHAVESTGSQHDAALETVLRTGSAR